MKKANFITSIILVPLDYILVVLAAISAYYLRFSDSVTQIRPIFYELPFISYLEVVFSVGALATVVFIFSGFYAMRSRKISQQLPQIITGVSTVVIFLIIAIFFKRELFSSRFIIILAWALAILYLFTARLIILIIRNILLKNGWGMSATITLGSAESRALVTKEYQEKYNLGYRVVAEFETLTELQESLAVNNWLAEKKVENIIQTDSNMNKDQAIDLLTFAQENHLNLKYVASLFQAQSLRNVELNTLAGLPLIEIKNTPLEGWRRIIKRFFDLFLSIILLIVLSPFILCLAIIIKSTSDGPVFVKLQRVGLQGKTFTLYKFRSMVKDAEKMKEKILQFNERGDGPLFKMKNDPRITKFGHWLRRTSFDELPQLINVLRGEMSLVGPRPHEPVEVSAYQRGYRKLLNIRPGITGLAQVSGRSNLLFADEAKLDIFYIENWSVQLDIIILLKTLIVPFKNKDAA